MTIFWVDFRRKWRTPPIAMGAGIKVAFAIYETADNVLDWGMPSSTLFPVIFPFSVQEEIHHLATLCVCFLTFDGNEYWIIRIWACRS